MRLRDYIVAKSEANAPIGITNKVLRRIALRAGLSPHTLHSISLGRRFASKAAAARISKACDGHVEEKGMINHERKKPGPARRPRAVGP
jgi:hypothetical protein